MTDGFSQWTSLSPSVDVSERLCLGSTGKVLGTWVRAYTRGRRGNPGGEERNEGVRVFGSKVKEEVHVSSGITWELSGDNLT